MESRTHQAVGIDCSKDDFAVTFSIRGNDLSVKIKGSRKFPNSLSGFRDYLEWIKKFEDKALSLVHVMEATGVYHERLALFLKEKNQLVSVVFPSRAKSFARTLKVKTVTDKEASKALATMGLEKKLDLWELTAPVYRSLKQLTRERQQLLDNIIQVQNEMHAELAGAWPNKNSIKRIKARLNFLENQKKQIEDDLNQILKENKDIEEKIKKVCTIKGVSKLTVMTIVAETEGFAQVRNKRQLVSYAGYDIVEKQSGTSVHGKARISKRGNKRIRRALHMPSLAAIRYSEESKDLFLRVVTGCGIKMKGVVAVQRKLLVLIYTLWKNDVCYDPNYLRRKKEGWTGHPEELDHVRSIMS